MSHAEGYSTVASGYYSHAQNYYTIAQADSQTAIGKYNIADTTSAFIIGNGTTSARSNALTVDWNGNAYVARALNIGNTDFTTGNSLYVAGFGYFDGDVTVTGALNLANGTWNKLGDDAQFGDNNIAGAFNIQGLNGATNLRMVQYNGTAAGTITWTGSGFTVSHTITGNLSGNASTATKLATARTISLTGDVTGSVSFDGSGNISLATTVGNDSHSHSNYLPLAGGTMTGQIKKNTASSWVNGRNTAIIRSIDSSSGSFHVLASAKTPSGSWEIGSLGESFRFSYVTDTNFNAGNNTATTTVYVTNGGVLMGAAWNDYAEYRTQKETIEPGYCVASADNGQVYKTTEKFQACDGIVSDTFGFAIGETDECNTPLAVAGRVLAYCEGNRYDYHSGDTVCAGPDGKVVKMTREEIREWPDRIIGIVSEIPEYETWGSGNVLVNGRIWIKVK